MAKFPKGYKKIQLVNTLDELNEFIGKPKLACKSKAVQVIVDTLTARLASVDPVILRDTLGDPSKEVLVAFGVLDEGFLTDEPSEDLVIALKKRDGETYGPSDPDATIKMPSKKELKKMAKAAKKAEKEAAKAAKKAAKEGKKKGAKKGGTKGKRPGVIAAIREILSDAKKPGLTLNEVANALGEKFPERDIDAMTKTVRAQLGGKKRPLRIENDNFTVKIKGEGKGKTFRA